jgi:Lipase maturation factor
VDWLAAPESWWARLILERGVAAVYVVAFTGAAVQFRGLIGTRGMLPVPRYVARRRFWSSPSVFALHYSDRFFAAVCWTGALAAAAMVAGLADLVPLWAAALLWLVLWASYLSIVNVGQIWYSFGWESLLLEAGFLVVFLGNDETAPPLLVMWLVRWLLFRVEFGAGLIKLRGDRCWRDLTCLDYHYETQPMPGPLSWFFHRLPKPLHRVEVAGNHVVQLVVPFGLFAPQPVASTAAAIIVVSQFWLVLSGNFSWLNWLTIVLAAGVLDTSTVSTVFGVPPPTDATATIPTWFGAMALAYVALVLVLSWRPARNLMSRRQRMNASFDAFHLVNSYGAFGSIGRIRQELVFEGTADVRLAADTQWTEYEFKGKPGDVRRLPRQWSPYHLRLDWLMWFAALSPSYGRPWIGRLCTGMLTNDRAIMALLQKNPFTGDPPQYVRALLYRYRYTTMRELVQARAWWHRELIGVYLEPIDLREAQWLSRGGG